MLAHEWPSFPLYTFPVVALLPCVIKWIREDRRTILLMALLWQTQLWFPELIQFEERPPFPGKQDNLASPTRAVGPLVMSPEWELTDLPERVLISISEARAPSMRLSGLFCGQTGPKTLFHVKYHWCFHSYRC